eukprot:GGOE01036206.1.p1 GENE.GGOE01036206.1~~GGOE01036206.1.p1  ORF type:complete len:409 (-),score=121.99 GGOE01036206.1:159-1361(-)
MADEDLNPQRISMDTLKEFAPGLNRAPMQAEFEKVKETLLRNRKSIAALHDVKVMTQQARQMYARETRRQRKEKEREQRLCPDGKRWIDAEFFVKRHIRDERREKQLLIDNRRCARLKDRLVEDALLLVTRVSSDYETDPHAAEIFQRLRLHRNWTSVLVRRTKMLLTLLFTIRKNIVVIMPTAEQVKELIHSRGYCKSGTNRTAVTNLAIEKSLGDIDVICIEDLVRVLYEGGEHFMRCALFLWPFNLDQSFADRSKDTIGIRKGKYFGIRDRPEDFPRRLLQQMDIASGNAGKWLGPLKRYTKHKAGRLAPEDRPEQPQEPKKEPKGAAAKKKPKKSKAKKHQQKKTGDKSGNSQPTQALPAEEPKPTVNANGAAKESQAMGAAPKKATKKKKAAAKK